MLEAQKITIRGHVYQSIPFGAARQLKLLPGVLRLLSGPVASFVDILKGLPLEDLSAKHKARKADAGRLSAADLDVSAILAGVKGAAIRDGMVALADYLESEDGLILNLLRDTHRMKGRHQTDGLESCADDFDRVFQSDFLSLGMVLAWVIKVNFAPFLPSDFAQLDARTPKNSGS